MVKILPKVDQNNDGMLSFDEFLSMVKDGDVQTDYQLQTQELRAAFNKMDANGDGQVSHVCYLYYTSRGG